METILDEANRHGLNINESRYCGNVTAYLLGCDEVLQGWESLCELFTWAWNQSNNKAFLNLADKAEELESELETA